MNKELFIKEVEKLGINISVDTLKKLDKYYQILVEENKKYNLTAIIEENEVYLKHFYDSLTICKILEPTNQYILDIGTGAGFPGMVLKIVFPNIKIGLLDSTTKRCQFLEKIIKELNLTDINVINDRAEEYAQKNREVYDIVTSRAVAPLKHLLEYSIPLLKINGKFISLKSNLEQEIININNYYKKLYLQKEKIIEFELPNNGGYRTIYEVIKYQKTPSIYPRSYSQIKKKEI